MNPPATASNAPASKTSAIPRHLRYQKVKDGRKHPIRGLWFRNGRYYAQLSIPDATTGIKNVRRVPLEIDDNGVQRPAATVAEAVAAMDRLKVQRADDTLPVLKQTPKFNDYAKAYLSNPTTLTKRAKTIQTETTHVNKWISYLGETRLDKITQPTLAQIRDKMLTDTSLHTGRQNKPRTVNLAMTCLRNVLNKAKDDGWIKRLPTADIKPLKHNTAKKQLVPLESIKKLCDAAVTLKNGQQFRDLIFFLAYSGGRISESLRLKWTDIDWTQNHITIGSDGLSKNYKPRVVDFNQKLESHLKDMLNRRAPDSEFVFPSPQRGKKDKASKTFRETLKLARDKAGLPKFGFHDCRHFFASMCAMSDVSKDTVRDWMGHSNTKLLDEVYVHYGREYHAKQAAKVRFEPVVLDIATA